MEHAFISIKYHGIFPTVCCIESRVDLLLEAGCKN